MMAPLLLWLAAEIPSADKACAACHIQTKQYYGHPGNAMARALYGPEILTRRLTFRLGRYSYTLDRDRYTVTDGESTLNASVAYAFGQGAAGQTYVYRLEGRWFESRVSYYKETNALDLTLGAPTGEPATLKEAGGREMTGKDVVECFGCHTTNTGVNRQVDFARLQFGVGCENCHGSAAAHAAGFQARKPVGMKKLSAMTTEEQSDSCGRCHRTWADIAATGPRGVGNVRFQPYRLANSKCYDATDQRIACTACHDPHAALVHETKSYDGSCLACHAGAQKSCPKAKADCASCHMPRYEIPGSHHLFTDHQIRIVRPNEKYPN